MTQMSKIEAPPNSFKVYPAYLRSRDENRKLYGLLSKSLVMLEIECNRRQLRGEDVSHVRDFISRARREALS